MGERSSEVAIVGGGPAGAALAIQLASRGIDTAVLERWPHPRWRASGVYSSPLTRGRLAALGLQAEQLEALIRPIGQMVVEADSAPPVVLDYAGLGGACGLDRVRLERALLDRAVDAGARVHEGFTVRDVQIGSGNRGRLAVSSVTGPEDWSADVIVGADGASARVARAARVDQSVTYLRRTGLTTHRPDPCALPSGHAMDARMVIGQGWYCGICPVPGDRVNVGLVMPSDVVSRRLRGSDTPRSIIDRTVDRLPGARQGWQDAAPTDEAVVAKPLAHRVSRRAGPGWLLVGDTAGFLDPLSGEGIHRALVSAELAAEAIVEARIGRASAWDRYDRRMHARFAAKDVFSTILQLLIARPELLGYTMRRLASRRHLRRTFGRTLVDIEPASRVLAPRFLLALLRP